MVYRISLALVPCHEGGVSSQSQARLPNRLFQESFESHFEGRSFVCWKRTQFTFSLRVDNPGSPKANPSCLRAKGRIEVPSSLSAAALLST